MLEVVERPSEVEADHLVALIAALQSRGYRFVTPTPATHQRVLARDPQRRGRSLTDILGWNRPFVRGEVDVEIEALLDAADALERQGTSVKSRLRASSLGEDLYLHSAFPTRERDAVFFGPDTYRFARLIRAELGRLPCRGGGTIVDVGTGAGVGGIVAGRLTKAPELILTDINPRALQLARANVQAADLAATLRRGSMLAGLDREIDLAVANPPFIADSEGRSYRDGGGGIGAALSVEMTAEILPKLARSGRLILYTGSAIVEGRDALCEELAELAEREGCAIVYEEIDPDIFGEELERPAYARVDRIAAVSAVFARTAREV